MAGNETNPDPGTAPDARPAPAADETNPEEASAKPKRPWGRWGRGAALVGAGLIAGGILAGTVTAIADDDTRSDESSSDGSGRGDRDGDGGGGGRADEEPLTGDIATQVEEAALEEYPDATVIRLETDSDGVYEAHLEAADGTRVTVEVDESFTVTGEESQR